MKKFVFLILGVSLTVIGGLYIMLHKKPSETRHVLRFALPLDIPSLDVNSRGHDVNAGHIMDLVFEGLMRGDKDGIPQLAIAHKVALSQDKKTYTFHLRNCQWSDETEITAYDFEYAWKRAINPNSKYMSQVPYYFYTIKNAQNCFFKKASIEDVAIKAIDPKTFEVELESPNPYFLHLISCSLFCPIPKHIVEKDADWANKPHLVCNGPFRLKAWKKNNYLQLEKNSHYWNHNHVAIQGIEVSIIPSTLTAFHMFEKGELDWFGEPFTRVPDDLYPVLREKQLLQEKEGSAIFWLFVNTEKYPLNNKKLRQALSYAINRDVIVKNLLHGFASPARGLLSPPLQVTNTQYFHDDVAQAQKLFQEALEEMGLEKKQFPKLEFSCVIKAEGRNPIAQVIQEQWRKHLGISISIKESEWHSYFKDVEKGNYDIGLMGWKIPCSNPEYLLRVFENKTDLANKSFWENIEFQGTIEQMRTAVDMAERNRATMQAEKILMEEMPIIPLVFPTQVFAKNTKLKEAHFPPFSTVDFTSAYFE